MGLLRFPFSHLQFHTIAGNQMREAETRKGNFESILKKHFCNYFPIDERKYFITYPSCDFEKKFFQIFIFLQIYLRWYTDTFP